MDIPAKITSQEQLNQDFWLVTLETSPQINSWQLGTSFFAENNFGTLLYPNNQPTLLSRQAWNAITEVTIKLPENKLDPSQPTNQLWLGENLGQAIVFDAAKRWNISQSCTQKDPYPAKSAKTAKNFQALLATDSSFIFTPKPAKFILPLQAGAIGASQLLEDYKIPNRLASQEFIAGCHNGDLLDLYLSWLETLKSETTAVEPEAPEEISSQNWQVFAATSQETFQKIYQANIEFDSNFSLYDTPTQRELTETHSNITNRIQLIKI